MGKRVGAAEFKAHCLRILDEIEHSGEAVTVTKRGRPVVEVKPIARRVISKLSTLGAKFLIRTPRAGTS